MPCAAFLCAAGSLLLDFPVHFIPLSGAETNKTMSGKLCRNLPGVQLQLHGAHETGHLCPSMV